MSDDPEKPYACPDKLSDGNPCPRRFFSPQGRAWHRSQVHGVPGVNPKRSAPALLDRLGRFKV